ncbi:MAG: hypothetical protein EOP53_01790 [Sphingobacteriales bacterium]|nr:MAG: hypothetical protein EOP53_01790 [Sphingobacteriales bacterium]
MDSGLVIRSKLFYIPIYFIACALVFLAGCNIFKSKPKLKQQQIIGAIVNNSQKNYSYQIKGSYNKTKHTLNIRGIDTANAESNTLVLNIELGADTTLAMLKFPRLYSAQTDTFPKRQISYAGLHIDIAAEETLYENYTYRRQSDLKITLLSFSKDSFLQGNFSGTLFSAKKRLRLRDGKFAVYVKNK